MNNRFYSIADAANILGVSTKTLRRWDQQGRLVPTRTVGNQRRYTQAQIDKFRSSAKNAQAALNAVPQVPPVFSETEAPKEFKATHSLPSVLRGLPSGSFLRNHFLLKHKDEIELSTLSARGPVETTPATPSLARSHLVRSHLAKLNPIKMGFVFGMLVLVLSLAGALVVAKYDLVAGLAQKKDQFAKFIDNLPQISLQIKDRDLLARRSPTERDEVGSFVPPDLVGAVLAAAAGGSDLVLNINIPTLFSQNVGIGIAAQEPSAVLNVASEDKGFLAPRMTQAQMEAIDSPAPGLFVYNTDTNHYNMYNGTSWQGVFSSIGDSTTGEAFTETGTSGTALYFYDADGRGKLTTANLSGARTYTLPDTSGEVSLLGQTIGNSELVNSKVTVSAGTNMTGGGEVALGSSITLTLKDSISLSGTLTAAGATLLNGNVGLGDAVGDAITFFGRVAVDSDIIPIGTTGTNDLGTSSLPWDNLYADNVFPASSGTSGYWQRNSQALSPTNITDDILIGGISTSSAKIAFINIAGGTPTATISGDLTLDSAGVIRTTKLQTLTIGGTTTGNIVIDSGSSTITLSDDVTATGDLAVNGGDLTTTAATFNFVNAATTLNIGSTNIARTVNLGTGTEIDTINIGTGATGVDVIRIGQAAADLALTDANWSITTAGLITTADDLAVNGADITTTATTFNLVNTTATTVNFAGAATTISIGASTGTATINNATTAVTGNLTIAGTTGITSSGVGAGITFSGTGNHDITASAGTLRLGAFTLTATQTLATGIDILVAGAGSDLGSSTTRLATVWADTVNATSLTGTVTGGSTSSSDWLINSGNATEDTSNGSLTFERGNPATNTQLLWNSTTKQLSTNSPSFAILPDSAIAYSGTSALMVNQIQAQDIFTASASGTTRFTIENDGDTVIVGDLAVNGATSADITSSTTTGTLFNATVTTLSLGGAATTFNIGTTDSVTRTINFGTGTGADTINIGTGATTANTVNIGTGAVANTIAIGSSSTTGLSLTDDNWSITTAGLITTADDLAVNGGDMTTSATTFNLVNATATTVNFAGAATTLTMGGTTGTATIRNATVDFSGGSATVSGNLTLYGAARTIQTTALNTLTIGGTTTGNIVIDSGSSTITLSDDVTATGDLAVNGGDLTTTAATFSLVNAATTLNLGSTNIARTLNIGTGTEIDTINIGTGATGVDVIRIGQAAADLALTDANWSITTAGLITTADDLAVNGGDITTTVTGAFNLVNANAATVNFAQAATTLTMGATTGTATIRNATVDFSGGSATVSGNLTLYGAARTIQTTALNTLTIGGTTTGNIVIDSGSSAITLSDTVSPTTSDGAALGTTSLMWSDLFLASGSVINLNNGDVTLTHASNALTFAGGNVGLGGQTSPLTELDVTGSASLSANLSLRGSGTAHTFNILDNGTLNFQRSPGGDAGVLTALFIQNNGNVGIGDTTPDVLLDILSATTGSDIIITNTNATDTDVTVGFALVDGTNNFTLGVDDSVAGDPFKISTTALGTGDFLTLDSRTTTSGVSALTLATGTAPTIASAATAYFNSSTFTPGTVNFSGSTQITSTGTSANNALLFNQPSINRTDAATSLTIDQASNLFINGPTIASHATVGQTETITTASALRIGAGSTVAGTRGVVTNAYGLYVDAPTGATNNYAAVFASGNVGIGTTTPGSLFNVFSSTNFSTFERTENANTFGTVLRLIRSRADAVALAGGTGSNVTFALEGFTNNTIVDAANIKGGWFSDQTNDTTTRDSFIGFDTMLDNVLDEKMRIRHDGNIAITMPGTQNTVGTCHSTDGTGGVVASNFLVDCSGAPGDIAEWYDTTSDVEVGDIVMPSLQTMEFQSLSGIGTITDKHGNRADGVPLPGPTKSISILQKSQKPYEPTLIGIVSTAPYQTFGEDVKDSAQHPQKIALVGRVPVKVSLENGPIAVGDRITSSSTPGVGMKATKDGSTIGTALAPYDGTQPGNKVLVFVNLGYQKLSLNTEIASSGSLNFLNSSSQTAFSLKLDEPNGLFTIASKLSATPAFVINSGGQVGVGTTAPAGALHVVGQCVTGDTLLKRRRRKKLSSEDSEDSDDLNLRNSEYSEFSEYEDVRIDQIREGDEILTLDEHLGEFVVSRINKLMEMGIQEVFGLKTSFGKYIKTTANHPYLALLDDGYIGKKGKKESNQNKGKGNGDFDIDVKKIDFSLSRFSAHKVPAFLSANATIKNNIARDMSIVNTPHLLASLDVNGMINAAPNQPAEMLTNKSEIIENQTGSTLMPLTVSNANISVNKKETQSAVKEKTKWVKVSDLNVGVKIATVDGWEKIVKIEKLPAEEVFDIEVEGTHNFIGNGIVAHNTYISGNTGIGTTAPSFKLDVQDSQTVSNATAVARIFNTDTGTGSAALVLKLGNTSADAVASTNHFLSFETAGIGIVGSISGNGAKGVTYATSGVADFAEYFRKDPNQNVEFGSVMCLNESGFAVLCGPLNSKILGIASERPAFLGGENLGAGSVAVGLVGQVETMVSNANGEILPGDALTSSDIPGVAVKATKPGQIVGKAIQPFTGTTGGTGTTSTTGSSPRDTRDTLNTRDTPTIGKILVSVNVGWYDPTIYIASDGTLGGVPATTTSTDAELSLQGDALQTQVATSSAQVSYALENDSLFQSLKDKVLSLESKLDLLSLQFEQQASISGTLAQIQSGQILGASASAALSLVDLELNNATIAQDLMVLGRTTVTDLGVTGNINAGLLAIHGIDGEINTLNGALYLQKTGLGGVDILAGKVVVDTKGNMTVAGTITAKQIEANNYTVLGQQSIGSSTIPAGSTSIEVTTSIASSSSKIFLTSTSLTDKQITVVEKSNGKFTVAIPQPTTSPISFDWWIVGNKSN